jgi:hypothetical protein
VRSLIAAVAAGALTGCSWLSTRGPLAADRPDDCTTSYTPVHVDTWTGV